MRKILFVAVLSLSTLWCQAQEKVMNILKTDRTSTQTRVADLNQISFLTVEEGGQGLIVTTLDGGTTAVRFETNPVVTAANGKLVIKPGSADAIEFEISDIAEIVFGDTTTGIRALRDFDFVVQDSGALLRGIPEGASPRVYSIDGRSLPAPSVINGELQLNRATLGTGIFIVKVGTFSTKIKL